MLAELDVVVFLKTNDNLESVAEHVFGVLHTEYRPATQPESGATSFEASGLGFRAMLFPNSGDLVDPEFESYGCGIEITSNFWCVELDSVDIEGPLSEYYARQLAFELNVETATEVLLETTEDVEIFEIRAYRRNPQYRQDMSPTTPKVFVIETRQVEEAFDDEEDTWEDEPAETADVVVAEIDLVADVEMEER
ncbi:MAG: hypothetical protein ACRDFX_02760 [Chloroflexota bacterium]